MGTDNGDDTAGAWVGCKGVGAVAQVNGGTDGAAGACVDDSEAVAGVAGDEGTVRARVDGEASLNYS